CVGNDDRLHREYVTSLLSDGQVAANGNGLFKLDADPRVTRVGGLLRRSSLDELPQLINVLRGDMSLVGPRPVLPWEAKLFDEPHQRRFAVKPGMTGPGRPLVPPWAYKRWRERHRRRFGVKPGMTGLWQVSGRSRLSMRTALELGVEYVIRRSFILDLAILARTLPAVLRGGAS